METTGFAVVPGSGSPKSAVLVNERAREGRLGNQAYARRRIGYKLYKGRVQRECASFLPWALGVIISTGSRRLHFSHLFLAGLYACTITGE